MTTNLFLLQSHKFSNENIQGTLVCPKCDEVFKKEFPLDLEGQIIEFKCSVCNSPGEADLPYKGVEEREEFEGILPKSKKRILKNLKKAIEVLLASHTEIE
ncbi:MAG TPA: hypothetical protein VIP29_05305 [Nitrososphaeraceae archaeon]